MAGAIDPEECRRRAYELRHEAASNPTSDDAAHLLVVAEEYERLAVEALAAATKPQ